MIGAASIGPVPPDSASRCSTAPLAVDSTTSAVPSGDTALTTLSADAGRRFDPIRFHRIWSGLPLFLLLSFSSPLVASRSSS